MIFHHRQTQPFNMKKSLLNPFFLWPFAIVLSSLMLVVPAYSQQVFDANFANIDFLAANKVHKVGTNGSAAGNITLYTNVITIGSQQIDCIVTTVSISGGTFTLPGSAAGGTIPFDYSSSTGTGMSANLDRYFAPTFSWDVAGGSCKFLFQFILGGSYNNTTNTGTNVILQNVYLNTYDIDGNGGTNSNQYNDFGEFNSAQLLTGTGSNIIVSYSAATGLTRFRSSTNANTTAVTADANRIRIIYTTVSHFEIVVGGANGAAYYFLDIGQGPVWTTTPTTLSVPVLDLNTGTTGIDNTGSFCKDPVSITAGATNLTGTVGTISAIDFVFERATILNGTQEMFIPTSPASSTDTIKLGFTSNSTQNFTLSSVTYNVAKIAGGTGVDTIRITPTSGTFTTAQVEAMLDAMKYYNGRVPASSGTRNFEITVLEGAYKSVPAVFAASFGCPPLNISGNVYNDADGMTDNQIDGTGSNGGGTYINLVSAAGYVLSSKAIAADGTFSFATADGIQPSSSYTLILSSSSRAYGSSLSTYSAISGWASVGEKNGTGTGNDGTVDGKLSVSIVSTDVSNAILGMNQLPISDNKTDNVGIQLSLGRLYELDNFPLSGSDPELSPTANSVSTGATFVIKTIPAPADATLLYNGVPVTANTTISNYDPYLLAIRFNDISKTSTSFTYALVDAAGQEDATPATYNINLLYTLPVTGFTLTGQLVNNIIQLKWSTQTEINSKAFIVEQSTDAIHFTAVSNAIAASGNSTQIQRYHWSGSIAGQPSILYYRVKQMDVDGKMSYSNVWQWRSQQQLISQLNVHPNPAQQKVYLQTNLSKAQLKIIDGQGRIVMQQPWVQPAPLQLNALKPGYYTIILQAEDAIQTARLMKL